MTPELRKELNERLEKDNAFDESLNGGRSMTDIRQVSDAALSRWICEKLEPQPTHNFVPGQPSPKGFWRSTGIFKAGERIGTQWLHCDMVSDPAMTVMLVKTSTNYGYLDIVDDACAVGIFDAATGKWIYACDLRRDRSNLGRAVAESFALANGYPETLDRTTKE